MKSITMISLTINPRTTTISSSASTKMDRIGPRDNDVTAVIKGDDRNEIEDDNGEVVELHVQRHGGNIWLLDDFPCMGPAFNELSDQDQDMVRWAMERRSVVVRDITYYVYCRNMASWWQMESPTASQELSDIARINAPVSCAAALRRFYPLLTRVTFPLKPIKKTVYIGTYKLRFTISYTDKGPIVKYKPHKTVIDNPRGNEHKRMYITLTNVLNLS